MIPCVWSFSLFPFLTNAGLHRHDSVQWSLHRRGYVDYNARETPTTADTSELHRKYVGIDATLLGA